MKSSPGENGLLLIVKASRAGLISGARFLLPKSGISFRIFQGSSVGLYTEDGERTTGFKLEVLGGLGTREVHKGESCTPVPQGSDPEEAKPWVPKSHGLHLLP